jgi:hypothetical protein
MNVEPIESLMRRIMDQYNEKPEGWSVLTDHKGNVLVLGSGTAYRLKLIPLNPQEYTGVGVRIGGVKEMREAVEGVPSYGFRPLSGMDTKNLLSAIHRRSAVQNRVIKKLLGINPVPTWELHKKETKTVLGGPVIAHPNLSAISKSQRELEVKLAVEADKLFRTKYPGRAAIYR